ncbi:hypothetical protein [Gordonia polyisoprenivorans]|uniref:ORC-CDC6 family AAA ATPase n=1 Tax=Gordonia polyisoprenivorans TaxID=84595 RepID=UPI0013141BC0|nr:hypothetical protein [Gordonia polyisoprenivorans]
MASGTQHLVDIRDAFDASVLFEGEQAPLDCHVAVLDYIEGSSLRSFLEHTSPPTSTTAAQIASDLLRLLQELENKGVFHNDLHGGNILVQRLSADRVRGDEAIDPFTRVVAVDLGSVLDTSRSDEKAQIADTHQVTAHLMRLALRVVPDPVTAPDIEYRLALALNDIANLLKPDNISQRNPNYSDLIFGIKSAFVAATSPWKEPSEGLIRFGDSFNAQTMRPWFVPRLLVDPDNEWTRRIESSGPLVVTGMRGCGKTMLLRALQFHARASSFDDNGPDFTPDAILDKLKLDGYVGLYVSCNRLLDGLGKPDGPLHEPHTRLFLCYARESLQALRHLAEIGGRSVLNPVAPQPIVSLIKSLVGNSIVTDGDSLHVLERKILEMLRSLESGSSEYQLAAHPAVAMPSLAAAVTECADTWTGARVLFLLDDVSTRHLNENSIQSLLSSLMFVNESCAFKVTTEAQTLELVLKSPGLVETARSGRDYDTFDLASAIYAKLRDSQGRAGREFVARVLQQRADLTPSHPHWTPREILGDQPLVEIARRIASSTEASHDRKNVYFGLSALAAVCVGDIGDVISIYELILSRSGNISTVPVAPKHQSSAFQEFCSRRLYQLSRRGGLLKQFADGFAKASHDLLIQSAQRNPDRIRDYASIYVRVTAGDTDRQLKQLRELMDAGVFVLTGGPDAPRTKARDSDPLAQYTLTFRKLLGLSSAIGLSQRDRFELSGQNLIEWLDHPEISTEILKRNLATTSPSEVAHPRSSPQADGPVPDLTLFDSFETDSQPTFKSGSSGRVLELREAVPLPAVTELDLSDLNSLKPAYLVTALGFEERALESTRRVLANFLPQDTITVSYPLNGFGSQIAELLAESSSRVRTVASADVINTDSMPRSSLGVVDITGLSKKFIYHAVRKLLIRDRKVVVVYTEADRYYPLDEDVASRLDTAQDDDYARLEACQDILTGEVRPYRFVALHEPEVDDGRRRVLVATSSAKHERLFSLLEERDYDHVEILAPSGVSPREQLALLAARVAAQDANSCEIRLIPANDLSDALLATRRAYEAYYALSNFNFEVGLTGSKLHAVALAAASTSLKFSQAWYVEPHRFDSKRFTEGVGTTHALLLETPPD